MFRKSICAATAFFILGCGGGKESTAVTPGTGGTGGTGGAGNCPANSICMTGSTFTPSSLTVARGTTVSFVNSSGTSHNVNFTSNSPAGGDIPTFATGSVSRVMGTAGSTNFFCNIHGTATSGMTGQIIVQ